MDERAVLDGLEHALGAVEDAQRTGHGRLREILGEAPVRDSTGTQDGLRRP
jgi:hypothetical protein